ncbi:GTP--adenosylcobinamide-phosphate guanylyltransferase [Thermococcus sp. MV5]|uniref:NTP transferase domain-containing protein n=1 Tax=Thermococcus sp. MV5 TaxID=1638272 RepID=UPI00143BAC3E|nr:NTP transferase domain-containing protein [Thermococcus sp. MV5]NJE26722.1 GTP--adenosylcobinamide-phosphate guanylyltransferase [Thermococcus sp. MV5]
MIIIMAGGKSSRMGKEKPILKIAGKEMLLWVYDEAVKVDETFVALSKNTPRTRKLCLREKIPFIETSGKGYVNDLLSLLQEFGPFVSIAGDIPFVKGCDILEIKKELEDKKVSITGILPLKLVPKDLKPLVYNQYAIIGLNGVSYTGEYLLKLRNPLLALNVNTPQDLELAEKIATLIYRE